jgi:hypothetical protein
VGLKDQFEKRWVKEITDIFIILSSFSLAVLPFTRVASRGVPIDVSPIGS